MIIRRTSLWKRISSALLHRRAVRVVFVPPGAPMDEKIERALKSGEARPMDPAFFSAIKDFLTLAEEKNRQWTEVIRPQSDVMMSGLWQKLWRTPAGRNYKDLSDQVARRKTQVDAAAKAAEDGLAQKILASGKIVSHIKTRLLVGREEMLSEAQAEVERLRGKLAEAQARLKDLRKAREGQLERINLLVVREIGKTPRSESRRLPAPWARRSSYEEVAQAIADAEALDELMIEPIEAMDASVTAFIEVLQDVAQSEATENDFGQIIPETEETEVLST